MAPLTLNLGSAIRLSDQQFYQLCRANQDLHIERTAEGNLIIMPPSGGETGSRNLDIEGQLWLWNRQTQLGKAFNSSTGFHLPNGADRSPDAAWVRLERWQALTPEQRQAFPPLAPDFVVELHSSSDNLQQLQAKMQEYVGNGVRLGWLINPQDRQVEIYRPGQAVEILETPRVLAGEEVLPNFALDLTEIW